MPIPKSIVRNARKCLLLLHFSTCIITIIILPFTTAEILFKECTHQIDLGKEPSKGHIFNSCIRDHEFLHEDHAWDLEKSNIRQTKFTSCTFRSVKKDRVHSLSHTAWTDVEFIDSVFISTSDQPSINFTNVYMRNVNFVNCSFTSGTDIVFESFDIKNLLFDRCNVAGRLLFTKGDAHYVSFQSSTFGARKFRDSRSGLIRHHGDVSFSYVNLYDFQFVKCRGDANAISVSHAEIAEFKITQSTVGIFECVPIFADDREETSSNTLLSHVQMNYTDIYETTFADRFTCVNAAMLRLTVREVSFHNAFNLSQSTVIAVIRGLTGTSKKKNKKSVIDMDKAIIPVRSEFTNISNVRLSWRSARIAEGISTSGWDWADGESDVDIRGTVFTKARVGGHCCSELCTVEENDGGVKGNGKGCFCDVTETENGKLKCPPIGEDVRFEEAEDDTDKGAQCFPADAIVYARDGERVRMEDLKIGTHVSVETNNTGMRQHYDLGVVYFFGHKSVSPMTQTDIKQYTFISMEIQAISSGQVYKLRMSSDHLLATFSRGKLAARQIRIGDAVYTIDGKALVTNTSHVRAAGLYAPVTTSGTVVVDGVFVSCFTTAVDEIIGHALLLPVRWLLLVGGGFGGSVVMRWGTWLHSDERAGHVRKWRGLRTYGVAGMEEMRGKSEYSNLRRFDSKN